MRANSKIWNCLRQLCPIITGIRTRIPRISGCAMSGEVATNLFLLQHSVQCLHSYHTHTQTHTHTHTLTHSLHTHRTHTFTHMHARAHKHTHIHIHTRARARAQSNIIFRPYKMLDENCNECSNPPPPSPAKKTRHLSTNTYDSRKKSIQSNTHAATET